MIKDKAFRLVLALSGIAVAGICFLSFISLWQASRPAIARFGLGFIASSVWDPMQEAFGAWPFIAGTIITSILALAISIPFSLAIAIFLTEYFKEGIVHNVISAATDLLAGIPSVIYGFWGLFVLVPIIRRFQMKAGILPYGVGIFTASLVLAIMVIPYTSMMAREALKLVPSDLKEAGFSLGASRFDIIRRIILPYSRSGIIAGIFLAFGRAFGETMAVTMVIGNSSAVPKSLFAPANTMASVIANEFAEAVGSLHTASLVYLALILFVISFLINLIGVLLLKGKG